MISWFVQATLSTLRHLRPHRGVISALLALAGLALVPSAQAQPAGAAAPGTACPTLLQHTLPRLQDEKPQSLCQYAGRAVLVVNTASYCGFTGQYKGLEALHQRYQARGLVVLGFPANDFGRQEPGSNAAIADFCENTFGVQFPMFSKIQVVGRNAHPLYQELAQRTGERPGWNFHKYLIARDGTTVRSYPSALDPNDPGLIRDIEKIISPK
ncbi:glutathione peroxidase [Hydrogenophaga sp.]|uniref:glutathione peroxidase n=1 Tax=Hydrogenophaga sp. TaxID=1904254 RepID=UPI0025C1EDB9|nr:glutathione peroxidase [Hydrogenophaga sp.]